MSELAADGELVGNRAVVRGRGFAYLTSSPDRPSVAAADPGRSAARHRETPHSPRARAHEMVVEAGARVLDCPLT